MDTHTAPRPTGRRKITLPQLRAEAARAASPIATTPGRAVAALKRAEPALGVSAQVVKLLDYLVGRTRPQDWDGTGLGPIAWPSDAELEARLGVGRSRCKDVVRAALDHGFVRMRRSPNGRRYGHRDRKGRITQAYGFDLVPLAERMAEFERLAAEWEVRRDEGKQLRREVACLRGEVLALVELATAQGYGGEDWAAFAAQAEALKRARGSHRDPLALIPIVARLRALHVRVRELVEAAAAAGAPVTPEPALTAVSPAITVAVEGGETGPMGPEYRPYITTTNQLEEDNLTVAPGAAGPNRPKAQETRSCQVRPRPRESGQLAPASASALRGFVLTPDDLLRMAPAFRAWVASASPSWHELAEAAFYVCGELGISKRAWGQACVVLGRMEAIGALAVVATRHEAGQVRSPEALLRKMVELHQLGELWLDKSLFGLAAGASREAGHRCARPGSIGLSRSVHRVVAAVSETPREGLESLDEGRVDDREGGIRCRVGELAPDRAQPCQEPGAERGCKLGRLDDKILDSVEEPPGVCQARADIAVAVTRFAAGLLAHERCLLPPPLALDLI